MRKSQIPQKLRQVVKQRAHACCEYCLSQEQFSTQPFSVDHIIPVEKGGDTTSENLAFSCQGCNNHKYTKTEGYDTITHRMVPLYHPRSQQWDDHFVWNEDCTLILGVTPTGRATVETLHLNRAGVVNLRHILLQAKKHPPDEEK
ncbi:HNH endonuclease [Candidatus Vecturithrix granuli]|uniref:HNH endonuclease n=1 Tax=Vecturithrix granuli TaxID=1499967 RepID=A0A081C0J9_VECG1|nr:HNH endonuclease [Candidatus Vecturithrix granuli]